MNRAKPISASAKGRYLRKITVSPRWTWRPHRHRPVAPGRRHRQRLNGHWFAAAASSWWAPPTQRGEAGVVNRCGAWRATVANGSNPPVKDQPENESTRRFLVQTPNGPLPTATVISMRGVLADVVQAHGDDETCLVAPITSRRDRSSRRRRRDWTRSTPSSRRSQEHP